MAVSVKSNTHGSMIDLGTRASFNDHEVILGLGLQSVLNMPVRSAGITLGTMNLLHECDYYSDQDLEIASLLATMLVGPLRTRAVLQKNADSDP